MITGANLSLSLSLSLPRPPPLSLPPPSLLPSFPFLLLLPLSFLSLQVTRWPIACFPTHKARRRHTNKDTPTYIQLTTANWHWWPSDKEGTLITQTWTLGGLALCYTRTGKQLSHPVSPKVGSPEHYRTALTNDCELYLGNSMQGELVWMCCVCVRALLNTQACYAMHVVCCGYCLMHKCTMQHCTWSEVVQCNIGGSMHAWL